MAALPIGAAHAAGTLQDIAGPAGMLFGAAVNSGQLFADARFRAAVIRETGSITPELEMKWSYVEREEGKPDFTDADRLARFATESGKDLHGHALLWHRSIPEWAVAKLGRQADWSVVRDYFASIMPRYGSIVRTWDVVNEPLYVGEQEAGLRASPFLAAFGEDYIRRAFDDAHMLAPHATLFLNEFGLIYDVPEARQKRDLLLRLIEKLKNAGVPVGGVGLQAHLELARSITFNERVLHDFLNRLGEFGLQVRISELDVLEADPDLPVRQRDARVAEAVRQLLDVALANRAVGAVTCWGLSDRYSWLPPHGGQAGLNRGLPLNSDLEKKPMYYAVMSALKRRAAAIS